jgi:hypothetical protein
MGWLQDLLTEIPLSSVLRERVAFAEERFEAGNKQIADYKQRIVALEQEIETLRAKCPPAPSAR